MEIGCLGDIIFHVSSEAIKTITKFVWSGKARYAVHHRHLTNALTEYTGNEPEEIKFDIELSVSLGINPMSEITKLVMYERYAKIVPLIIGGKPYGKYRWTVNGHQIKAETFDGKGKMTAATLSVKLLEYLKK